MNINDFFIKLERLLLDAVRSDFQEIARLIEHENLYAVSLVTDSSFDSIYLAVNTEEALAKQEYKYEHSMALKSDEFSTYLRWAPAEWLYGNSDIAGSKLRKVNQLLREKNITQSPEFEVKFYETVVGVFKRLDNEMIFSTTIGRERLTLFISMSDDDRAFDIENYSASLLNPEKLSHVFIHRFDKQEV